jgi:hypothetical protein
LVPWRYALRVGEIDVLVVSDGVLSLLGAMLGLDWGQINRVDRRPSNTLKILSIISQLLAFV